MNDKERKEPLDDFAVEITELDHTPGSRRPNWLRMTPRRRRLSLTATAALFVLVMGLLLVSMSDVRNMLGKTFGYAASTPDPSTLTGSMLVYLRGNPAWGRFILDGKTLDHTPVIGRDQPLTLARGLHTLIWQVDPFKPKTCVFTVVDASTARGPCFFNHEITASFVPGEEAMIIAFFASLNDLPADQRASLTRLLQGQFAAYDSISQVEPGEVYALSEEQAQANPALCQPLASLSLCYARADQPLLATLSMQMDTLTSNDDPCVTTSQCNSYHQDCRALCEDPVVDYGAQDVSGWSVDAVAGMFWSYRTLAGQTLAIAQPNTAIRGSQAYQLVSVHLYRDARGRWQITLFPTYGYVSNNPVCAQATNDTMSVLGVSTSNASNMYVRQSAANPTQMALGCLTVAIQPITQGGATPTPAQSADAVSPATFLLHFGVLLAVNPAAHKVSPSLPVVDATEKNIAQSLLTANIYAP
ncbi:MAG TPA: hypothetical protein VF458_03140 [Ktedonobacteraceae bacterium]